MMIGLATPTIEPLSGLNDGGRNTGSPVNGVGFWPAGVPSGMGPGGTASGLAGERWRERVDRSGWRERVDRRRWHGQRVDRRRWHGQRIRRGWRHLGSRGHRRKRCRRIDRRLCGGNRAGQRTGWYRFHHGICHCQRATERQSTDHCDREGRGDEPPHLPLRHANTSSQSFVQSRTARNPAKAGRGPPNPDNCPANDAELLCSSSAGVECYFLLVT